MSARREMGMTYEAVHVRIARVTWQMVFGQLQGQEAMREELRSMVLPVW